MSTAATADTIEPRPGPLTEREQFKAWLRTPESNEPVPDFVERELAKPFEIDLSGWEMVKPRPGFVERVVREMSRIKKGRTMRRKKGRIPKRHKLAPGRWHRDAWLSVAYAGPWTLRVHHKRAGWRAHIRGGSRRLWDLPAPVATRAEAENALVEAMEVLCAEVKTALEWLRRQPVPETIPDPPATDPAWHRREIGRWYRTIHGAPPRLHVSEADCGPFRLRVFRGAVRDWCACVESGDEPIFVEWSLLGTKIRTREHGETVALSGAYIRLGEIRAAIEILRRDVEATPRPDSAKDHPPEAS